MSKQKMIIRVLLVDDDLDIKNIIQSKLMKISGIKYEFTWDKDTTVEQMAKYDVVLLDHHLNLPDRTGLDILRELRNASCGVAVVFLTGDESSDIYHEVKEAGANGFLRKKYLYPFEMMERIDFAIINAKYAEEFRQSAMRDHLTKLYNRSEMESRLKAEFTRSRRYNHPLALIMLDVDYFKKINDRYGHPAGDAVLRQLAQCLRENCREADILCRYGGEEFLIIMPETELEAAQIKAEQLRQLIAQTSITFDQGQKEIQVNASLGVAQMCNKEEWESLIQRADNALYQAKEAGRNQVVVL
jgi:diguanylate cyclase (GGDEF)-like protein